MTWAASSDVTDVSVRWITATRVRRRCRAARPPDRNAAQMIGREVGATPRADQQGARRLPVGERGRGGECLEQLAGEIAPRLGAQDSRRTPRPAWLVPKMVISEDRNNEKVGVQVRGGLRVNVIAGDL